MSVYPRPSLRSIAAFLWDYLRVCIVAVLFVVLVMGVPLALVIAFLLEKK